MLLDFHFNCERCCSPTVVAAAVSRGLAGRGIATHVRMQLLRGGGMATQLVCPRTTRTFGGTAANLEGPYE
jgi:hypothetical protein